MSETGNIGQMVVKIVGDNAQFDSSIDKSEKKFKGFADMAGQIGKVLSVSVTAPILLAGKAALQSAADFEMYQAAFTTMLGDAAKAKSMLNDLARLAAETPLELPGLADATKKLLQYGVSADDIIPTLRMLGDVTLGNAAKFDALSYAYGQMRSAGRLMGQDLLQMINAGFNPLNEISKRTGESMADLRKRMSDGKVSVEEVTAAFKSATSVGGQFNDGMKRGSQTITGLSSTLRDDIRNMARSFAELFAPAVKDAIKNLDNMALKIAEFSPASKMAITTVAAFAASIGPIGLAIKGVSTALSFLAANPIVLAIAAVGALTAGFLAWYSATQKAAEENEKMWQFDATKTIPENEKKLAQLKAMTQQYFNERDALRKNTMEWQAANNKAEQAAKMVYEYQQDMLENQRLINSNAIAVQKAEEEKRKQIKATAETEKERQERLEQEIEYILKVTKEEADLAKIQKELNDKWAQADKARVEYSLQMQIEAFKEIEENDKESKDLHDKLVQDSKDREIQALDDLADAQKEAYELEKKLVQDSADMQIEALNQLAADEKALADEHDRRVQDSKAMELEGIYSLVYEESVINEKRKALVKAVSDYSKEMANEANGQTVETATNGLEVIKTKIDDLVHSIHNSLGRTKDEFAKDIANAQTIADGFVKVLNADSEDVGSTIADLGISVLTMINPLAGGIAKVVKTVIDGIFNYSKKKREEEVAALNEALEKQKEEIKKTYDSAVDTMEAAHDRQLAMIDESLAAELAANDLDADSSVEAAQKKLDEAKRVHDGILTMNEKQLKGINDFYENAIAAADAAADAQISAAKESYDSQTDILKAFYDEQESLRKASLDAAIQSLNTQEQAELYSLGLTGPATLEQYDAEIAKANEAGDAAEAAELEKARKKLEIQQKYDALRAEEEKKSAEAKAAADIAESEALIALEKSNSASILEIKKKHDDDVLAYKQANAKAIQDIENDALVSTAQKELEKANIVQKYEMIKESLTRIFTANKIAIVALGEKQIQLAIQKTEIETAKAVGKSIDYINQLIVAYNKAGGAMSLIAAPVASPVYKSNRADRRTDMAEGGVVMPRLGGTPITVAEGSQPEIIFPLDKLERFLSDSGMVGRGGLDSGGLFRVVVNLDSRPFLDKIFEATRDRVVLIDQGAVV